MKMELATRSRRRAPPTIIFWARLINLEFAAAFILSIETLDCRIPFRNIAHRNEPKAARLAGFAISDQFDFRNSAERLKPIFDSFKKAVADNQRLTSAQESVGTTSGSGGERDAQAISWRTGGGATSAARM